MDVSRWIPKLQVILRTLIFLAVAVGGIALVMYSPSRLYEVLVFPMPDSPVVRVIVGIVAALLGLLALAPIPKSLFQAKSIAFSDNLGTDTVRLAPLERTLTKEVSAQSEVKRAEVFLTPTADRRGVHVRAEVVLRKAPQVRSSEVRNRLKNFLLLQARELLGTDEVAGVELEVLDIVVERDLALEPQLSEHGEVVQTPAPAEDQAYEMPYPTSTVSDIRHSEDAEETSAQDEDESRPLPGTLLSDLSAGEEDEKDDQEEEPQA